MRYVPSYCLRPGQRIANDITLFDNRVFVRRGKVLSTNLINRIQAIGFQGAYIDDDISMDLDVVSIVSEELQYKAKKEIKSLYGYAEMRNETPISHEFTTIGSVIEDIVEQLLKNRHAMVNIVDLRSFDDYTYSHCLNVAILSVVVGTALRLSRKALELLAMGALLHDIGKVFIDKNIINKPGKLTDEEFDAVKKHCRSGLDYISPCKSIPKASLKAVLSHHERYNGKGYPDQLSGEDIPLFGRIVCVADVYDALTSDRPYRKAMLPSDALEYIISEYNEMFDPTVVDAFVKKVAPYPVGTCVKLSNDMDAIVIENFESCGLRPKVRIISEGMQTKETINLATDASALNLTIKNVVNV